LAAIAAANVGALVAGFTLNKGPNGVRIDLNWAKLAAALIAPYAAGLIIASSMRKN